MATTATIQSIGQQAISPTEPMLILFNETATAALQQIAIIQKFTQPVTDLALQVGSTLQIDDQKYKVAYVGELVNTSLASIGHATLYFTAVPAKPMQNGVYLAPTTLPTIKVGSVMTYRA
ncbi:PTS glucose transporter subunit IIA [Lactobacillus sp. CBA3606]|uniref:PTS glucitol/sorbitol transporter subunit IIA n=1 Tax=Lactobacillus sp. CBA3606 TaxID=2099789 RepID=UPI000CFC6286|nr:PTS glucitol/sorbitol transporter subunit IIA [Lactobacillus sp. CBA3606]AVK63279.1 PTS glucose transporter subunit IIA [Lactobacillus sp. CBA3606]